MTDRSPGPIRRRSLAARIADSFAPGRRQQLREFRERLDAATAGQHRMMIRPEAGAPLCRPGQGDDTSHAQDGPHRPSWRALGSILARYLRRRNPRPEEGHDGHAGGAGEHPAGNSGGEAS